MHDFRTARPGAAATRPRRKTARHLLLAALASVAPVAPEAAAQGFNQETPIPSTVRKSLTAIQRSFQPPAPPPLTLFPDTRQDLATAPPFLRDSRVELNVRSFFRDQVSNAPQGASINEAWAAGGALTVQTGRLFDLISGGAVFYTSLPMVAPPGEGNTGLLLPDQQGFAVVGQLYGRLHLPDNHTFTAGRAIYDTPFLDAQDNRMAPNTFYGYVLEGSHGDDKTGPTFRYGAGYIATMKPRDSNVFLSMSRAAGATVDRGLATGGGFMTWGPASIGAFEYYVQDIINIGYAEGTYGTSLPLGLDTTLALQYADQRSTGANLLTGSYFATGQFGTRLQVGRDGGIFTAAYTAVNPGYAMQNPWSFNPFYTDAQILSFQRPGENALHLGLSYTLTRLGLPGVAAAVRAFTGWTGTAAAGPSVTENEVDFTLEWLPDWKPLSGLWLQARYGLPRTNQTGAITAVDEVRLILNYKVKLY